MATDKTTKGYTKKVSLQQIFDGSLKPPVRKSRTTENNEHLFNPKSFKPKQKTMMAHALEFAEWLDTTYYHCTGYIWKNTKTGKEVSKVKVYKKFLLENKIM